MTQPKSADGFYADEIEARALLDDITDPVFSVSPDGRFLYTNRAWRETFGYSFEEIKSLNIFDLVHAESREYYAEIFRRVLAGEKLTRIEAKFVARNDSTLILSGGSNCAFRHEKPYAVQSIFRNVTERREAEERLRQSEREMKALVENSADVIIRFDAGLRCLYINPAFERIIGANAHSLIGKTMAEIKMSEAMRRIIEPKLQQALSEKQEISFEYQRPSVLGASFVQCIITPEFAEDGKTVESLLIVSRDITELKLAEERLRNSERHYREIVEGSQGFICTHDQTGKLLSVNPAAAAALGYTVSEIVGNNMKKFMRPEFHAGFDEAMRKVWENGEDSGLLYLTSRDGVEQVWKYHNIKLTETVDEPIILGHAQDVTDMYEKEKQLKNMSLTDELTGLYNRRGFLTFAERQLSIARTSHDEKEIFLIFADMDGLKQINDTYGHDEGSWAINKMGEIISSCFRGSDIIARLGGDEFVVLVIDEHDETKEIVTRRLEEKINRYNAQRNHQFDLSLSVGITTVNLQRDQITIEELLRRADKKMYEQKRAKKISKKR